MALLEFYGTECLHCVRMRAIVEQLEGETGVTVERFEVWHNEGNARKMEEYDTGLCGGVPFFFNTDTKAFVCGEASFPELEAWAKDGSVMR